MCCIIICSLWLLLLYATVAICICLCMQYYRVYIVCRFIWWMCATPLKNHRAARTRYLRWLWPWLKAVQRFFVIFVFQRVAAAAAAAAYISTVLKYTRNHIRTSNIHSQGLIQAFICSRGAACGIMQTLGGVWPFSRLNVVYDRRENEMTSDIVSGTATPSPERQRDTCTVQCTVHICTSSIHVLDRMWNRGWYTRARTHTHRYIYIYKA